VETAKIIGRALIFYAQLAGAFFAPFALAYLSAEGL
jgi:hypothetical protein